MSSKRQRTRLTFGKSNARIGQRLTTPAILEWELGARAYGELASENAAHAIVRCSTIARRLDKRTILRNRKLCEPYVGWLVAIEDDMEVYDVTGITEDGRLIGKSTVGATWYLPLSTVEERIKL